jgi:hypothetical protein
MLFTPTLKTEVGEVKSAKRKGDAKIPQLITKNK